MRNLSAGLLSIAGLVFASVGSASAAGPVSITQDKAIAGGVSSGDGPGFPILITDPGSYRLDSDLYPGTAPFGISISSPNVTLDFNGFRLMGGGGASDGVLAGKAGATIKNGTIANFRRYGIIAPHGPAPPGGSYHLTVDNMKIQNVIGLAGEAVHCGPFCIVRNSIITGNNNGIWADADTSTLIEGNTVAFNAGFQIRVEHGLILGNVIAGDLPITGTAPLVGLGSNTIISDDPPTGASPLAPNFCNPVC
jgi:hypothetical protein